MKILIPICALLATALVVGPGCGGCGKRMAEGLAEKAIEKGLEEANKQNAEQGKPPIKIDADLSSEGLKITGSDGTRITADQGGVNIQGKDGDTRISSGAHAKLPESWPEDVPLFEGYSLLSAVDNPNMTMLNMEVARPVAEVATFYDEKMMELGWEVVQSVDTPTGRMAIFSKDGFLCHIASSRSPKGNCALTLSLSEQKK